MSLNKTAICSAISLLKAHPEKHIVRTMFCDAQGESIEDIETPQTDDRICGMCMLGAIAYELNVNPYALVGKHNTDVFSAVLMEAGYDHETAVELSSEVWNKNDVVLDDTPELFPNREAGNPEVFDLLEKSIC